MGNSSKSDRFTEYDCAHVAEIEQELAEVGLATKILLLTYVYLLNFYRDFSQYVSKL